MKTWEDIFSYWQTFEVKQIEVMDFNPEVHDALRWFHKKKRLAVYLNDNPKNGTAQHLAIGHVKASEEIYAAYAIYATLRKFPYYDKTRSVQLVDVVRPALFKLDNRKLHEDYWVAQSKNVLPGTEAGEKIVWELMHEKLSRKEYVALSAQLWKHLADEWVTLKFPSS
ncbi:hypothetical protein [Methylophilus sp. Q8]|uniref:hypothetical protein n=1 Tax=Methylophilus sp. Q8 TaxID=1506586 RepID=UPI000646B0AB|nr:hypothetical protein [Methylophilus sp. Q8]